MDFHPIKYQTMERLRTTTSKPNCHHNQMPDRSFITRENATREDKVVDVLVKMYSMTCDSFHTQSAFLDDICEHIANTQTSQIVYEKTNTSNLYFTLYEQVIDMSLLAYYAVLDDNKVRTRKLFDNIKELVIEMGNVLEEQVETDGDYLRRMNVLKAMLDKHNNILEYKTCMKWKTLTKLQDFYASDGDTNIKYTIKELKDEVDRTDTYLVDSTDEHSKISYFVARHIRDWDCPEVIIYNPIDKNVTRTGPYRIITCDLIL